MARQGFRSIGDTPYVYQESSPIGPVTNSVSFGVNAPDSNLWMLNTAPLANVLLNDTTANILIDPAANGNVTLRANGLGDINLISPNITTTGGILKADITTGRLTIASGSTVIQTITGNTGGAISPTGGNINIVTANSTPTFVGAASTETLDFGLTNLALGSSLPAIVSAAENVAVGLSALAAIQFDGGNVAIGNLAMNASIDSSNNVAVGSHALALYNALGGSGGFNTAVGERAGAILATGAANNTLLGARAGFNYINVENDNVCINSMGVIGDQGVLRIGRATGAGAQQLLKAFICGIDGVNVGSVAKVVTMASDQLGTATITAGTNITVTPGANTITIATSGLAAFSWVNTAGGTGSVNTGYTTDDPGLVTITLPAVAAYGSVIRIVGKGAGGWRVAQAAGVTIHFLGSNTTTGVGGSLASTVQYDTVELLCTVANTDWTVISSMGNITIV